MDDKVRVVVSCIPGLEFITASECNEVFCVKSEKKTRGRVFFDIPVSSLVKLQNLRSVHHYWLLVSEFSNVWEPSDKKDIVLEKLEACVDSLPWNKALFTFNHYKHIENGCTSDDDPNLTEKGQLVEPDDHANPNSCHEEKAISPFLKKRNVEFYYKQPTEIKFRVTCSRNGKHDFTSTEASKYIGSGVKGKFNWEVNLENFDIEVLAFINGPDIALAMRLSVESKHNRNITCFGPTTLMATTAYCLLKLVGIKKGDIVCDPMCGGGAICLEGACSFPFSFQIGGECHSEGCDKARQNFENLEEKHKNVPETKKFSFPHTILQWDAKRIPLRNGIVDAVVCDLPFGKRSGYKGRNFELYPAVVKEMGRICKLNGKAVLLTQHKSAMNKTLSQCSNIWKKQASFFINMGGLNVAIYVLKRIKEVSSHPQKDVSEFSVES